MTVPTTPRLGRALPAMLAMSGLLLAWEGYATLSGISPTALPPPSRVVMQAFEHRAVLWANTLPTLQATLFGFAASLTAAFFFSVLIDFSMTLRRALLPVFIISQTLPMIAIAPLVVLWFGFGLGPKIGLVAPVTFFPMLAALLQGYRPTEPEL
ncbi:MAG: ABC transporter permease, partial [Devosia sp.]